MKFSEDGYGNWVGGDGYVFEISRLLYEYFERNP